MNLSLNRIKSQNQMTNIYIGSALLILSILDVFLNSFFRINISGSLPGNLSIFFPLILGFLGLSYLRTEYSGYKFLDSLNKNINCLGPKKKLDKFIKGSICGLANLRIATGIQGKVLTYMSYGLPVLCSKKVAVNFNNSVLTYNNNEEFVKKLGALKYSNIISNKLRKNSKKLIKNFSQEKINRSYLKIIKI